MSCEAASCLVAILDGEAEALKAGGVAGQLEDPKDSHDPEDLDHSFQVLEQDRVVAALWDSLIINTVSARLSHNFRH